MTDLQSNSSQQQFEDKVFAEQMQMLTTTAAAAIFAIFVVTVALAIYFWGTDYTTHWLFASFFVMCYRLVLNHTYKTAVSRSSLRLWSRFYTVGLCLAGAIWGVAIFLFGNVGDSDDKMVLMVIIACSVAGGAYFSVSHRPAAVGFIICSSFPFATFLLMGSTSAERTLGILALFFIVTLIRFAMTFSQWFENAIRARIAHEQQSIELAKALQNASHASQIQADFLANVSHEIRTPMAGLLSMLHFLKDDPSESDREEYVQVAYNSARTLQVLMNDILDMSKLQAGKFSIEPRPSELRAIIDDSVALLAPLAQEKGLELNLSFSCPDSLWLNVDGARIRQVIFNLVGNAIKFTEQGSVALEVNCESHTESHYQINFKVTDTGIGIPEQAMETLFDRFVQVDTTLSREHTGTGLGLAICRQLIELMSGELSATSTVGQGSQFTFTLPATVTDKPEKQKVKAKQPASGATTRYHLLIVDDNPVNLLILEKLIEKYHWSADCVTSGQEAIDFYQQKPAHYDLILMDIQMPGMDGFQATQAIRDNNEHGKSIPIIAVTANIYSQDLAELSKQGIDSCVTKPIDEKVLYTTITDIMSKGKKSL